MGPNPNGPLSCLLELLDTQVFSGSVDRGSVRWRFLGVFRFFSSPSKRSLEVQEAADPSSFYLFASLGVRNQLMAGNMGSI